MADDWRKWRPAIWLTMLGVAVLLLVSPPYLSAIFFGAAIGMAIRIEQRRRRIAAAAEQRSSRSARRKSPSSRTRRSKKAR